MKNELPKLLSIGIIGAILGIIVAIIFDLIYIYAIIVPTIFVIGIVSFTIYVGLLSHFIENSLQDPKLLTFSIIWAAITGSLMGLFLNRTEITLISFDLASIITGVILVSILGLVWNNNISIKTIKTNLFRISFFLVFLWFIVYLLADYRFGEIHISREVLGIFSGLGMGAISGFLLRKFSDQLYQLIQKLERYLSELLKIGSGSYKKKKAPLGMKNQGKDEISEHPPTANHERKDKREEPSGKSNYYSNRCMNCGTKNPDTAEYCMNCGKKIDESKDKSHTKPWD